MQVSSILRHSMTQTLQKWMTVWCGAVGLFGLVLVGSGWSATSGPITAVMELMNGSELVFDLPLRFSLGLAGAVSLGWSLTLVAVVRVANRLDPGLNQTLWTGITASIAVWYVLDSSVSVATGFWPNAVSNTAFLVVFLVLVVSSGVLRGQSGTARPPVPPARPAAE